MVVKVQFLLEDSADGQSIECECRSTNPDDKDSMSNVVAQYIAHHWAGLVMAARLEHKHHQLTEGRSLMQEEQVTKAGGHLIELPAGVDIGKVQ